MRRTGRQVVSIIVAATMFVAMIATGTVKATAAPERPWTNASLSPGRQAQLLLQQMTLEEKVALMTSDAGAPYAYYNAPIERLGIPALRMADAGSGVAPRGWTLPDTGGKATALPSEIALGATFSPAVARQYAGLIANEVRATGQNVLLAPDADIARQPWFGRISESQGESPVLNATLNSAEVTELQSHQVIATLKHFTGYNQEVNRNIGQNSVIDEQALHEVYSLAFATAIRQAGLGAVMCSYNKINGEYSCNNAQTNRNLLKGQLGFTGFVMTDFGALHDTLTGLAAGTDMETGTTTVYDGALLSAVQSGKASLTQVNQAVLRILTTMFRIGLFDTDTSSTSAIPVAAHNEVARQVEDKAITLLKNSGHVLPLSGSDAGSIALIGADANIISAESGSAWVDPTASTTTLQGLTARAPAGAVTWTPGNDPVNGASMIETRDQTTVPSSVLSTEDGSAGLTAQYWHAPGFAGPPAVTRTEKQVSYDVGFPTTFPQWLGAGSQVPVPPTNFLLEPQSVRYDGYLTAPATGAYHFSLTGWGDATMTLDGKPFITMAGQDGRRVLASTTVQLTAGSRHRLQIDYQADHAVSPLQPGTLVLQWRPPQNAVPPAIAQAVDAARKTKVAVVYVRTFESEERDRVSLKLPQSSEQLIREVAAVNPRTVVVLASGGPVTMPWLKSVAGVVQTYFGGQAQGAALADVLFGDVNPSGRLPLTYPRTDQTVPVANPWSGIADLDVVYREGVDVGYRGYEKAKIKPLFPFGYGLSYTRFDYQKLRSRPVVRATRDGAVQIAFRLVNRGPRSGSETVQVYVKLPGSSGETTRRFVAFKRVTLGSHRSRVVELTLRPNSPTRQLSYYETATQRWVTPSGTYRVRIGSSATGSKLAASVRLRGSGSS
jgi:beta-glucosidase